MSSMLSIGELARRTGTTPRMLRHWEATGILPPAAVDPRSGARTYEPEQEGRVQTIVALRANGFGLDAIRDLFDSTSDISRVRTVLDARRSTLAASIARDRAALRQLDQRLEALDRAREAIEATLEIGPLPHLQGAGSRAPVFHESEIAAVAHRLRERVQPRPAETVVQIYDGTTNPQVITVTVLIPGRTATAGTPVLTVAAADRGARVRLADRSVDLGDCWAALDAVLLERGLAAHGPFRHALSPDGSTVLSVPVRPIER